MNTDQGNWENGDNSEDSFVPLFLVPARPPPTKKRESQCW